jgi:hypothetical protein
MGKQIFYGAERFFKGLLDTTRWGTHPPVNDQERHTQKIISRRNFSDFFTYT